jgi:predicted ATP-dependent Lon-type protease
MSKPTPGSRWKSAVCDTEAVVVKPAGSGAVPECGGIAMIPVAVAKPADAAVVAGFDGGTLIGKRYADPESGLELLATKAGKGSLGVEGRIAPIKDAKPLPSSD